MSITRNFSAGRRASVAASPTASARTMPVIFRRTAGIRRRICCDIFPRSPPNRSRSSPPECRWRNSLRPATEDEPSALAGLPERFLFFPAQLWPHKNHLTLLKALKQIEAKHGAKIPLVLTGEKFSAAPGIFQFIAEQSMAYVRHLGKVTFKEMVALYQKASFRDHGYCARVQQPANP